MKHLAAILVGKSIFKAARLLKLGGGNAAPGLYGLKLDPNLVEKLISKKAKNIIVTGTNGKTTTSKLISHFLNAASEDKLLKNSSGSNLERGIASYLINSASLSGKTHYDFGVWELDEFAFNSAAPKIKPNVIILLNAFRDQLDRYGEVDTVVNRWKDTLSKLSKDTILIINQDDGNLSKAIKDFEGKIIKIGIKGEKITGESKSKIEGQPDYEAEILKSSDLNGTDVRVTFNGDTHNFTIPLPGIFNVYNFLAALALSHNLNLDLKKIENSLKDFKPSFGRNEKFEIQGKKANIFLIKNPVGATQVLSTILPHMSPKDSLLIALNDNFADGKDVSWIWDIEMERLKIQDLGFKIFVSGSRAYDMALRLKYAGVEESNMEVNQNLEIQLEVAAKATESNIIILPTYTALLELQKILVQKGIKKEYWKND